MVSVIIPAHNRKLELKRAIDSVLKQTIQDFEILIIDDYSDVELQPMIALYNDSRIKYFKLPQKGNANVCRNLGLKIAAGKYIAMLDSDDEWLPNHLERKIEFLTENKCDGVFGSYQINDGTNLRVIISRQLAKGENMANYILLDGKAATPTHVYNAICAKEIQWDEKLFRHQDYDFSIRFAEKFSFLPSQEVTCTVHWNANEKRTEHLESQLLFMKKHIDKISPNIYYTYFKHLFSSIRNRSDIDFNIYQEVKNECLRYITYLPLVDFLFIKGSDKNKIQRFFLRVKFCWQVFFNV